MGDLLVETAEGHDRRLGVSAFVLKCLAALTMLCDHVGAELLPEWTFLRVIGRMAFPLYAYFIAEGCRYTRNKTKRFLLVGGLALLCEGVYFALTREVTGTALVTFTCSIPMIYAMQGVKQAMADRNGRCVVGRLALFSLSVGWTVLVGCLVPMDYGIPGAFLPLLLACLDYVPNKTPALFRSLDRLPVRLFVFGAGLLLVWYLRRPVGGDIQLYSLCALLPIALYNGKPGPRGFKYGFYIFYPAHLVIIWLIGQFLAK